MGARPAADQQFHASVRLSDAWASARLCELLAGFSSADERLRLDAGYIRLKKATGELRERAQLEVGMITRTPEFEARVLLGRDHQQAISSISSEAEKTIVVFTDSLLALRDCGWLRLLVEPSQKLGPNVRIVYSSPNKLDVNELPALEILIKNGAILEQKRGIDTTLLIVDGNKVILTNTRSVSTSARQFDTARVGILFRSILAGTDFPFNLPESYLGTTP